MNLSRVKVITFLVVGIIAYLVLSMVAAKFPDLKVLTGGFQQALQTALSAAFGYITSSVLPVELKPKIIPDDRSQPSETVDSTVAQENYVARDLYDLVVANRLEWLQWAEYLGEKKSELSQAVKTLDTRQTLLRLMLFGMLADAIASCLCTTASYSPSANPIIHFGYISAAYCSVATMLGITVHLVRVNTTLQSARRVAFLSAAVVNICSLFISLPYTLEPMSKLPQVRVGQYSINFVVLLLAVRIILIPFLSALVSMTAFAISEAIFGSRTHEG